MNSSSEASLEKNVKSGRRASGVYTLIIGMPFGMAAIVVFTLISLFPPFDLFLSTITGNNFFRHIIQLEIAVVLVFAISLWFLGRKVIDDIYNKKPHLLISFLLSLKINGIVFVTILGYLIWGSIATKGHVSSPISAVLFILVVSLICVVISTATICFLIVKTVYYKVAIRHGRLEGK